MKLPLAMMAGCDPKEDFTNRSYKGKTVTTFNEKDLDLVMLTKKQMGDKPVVVVVRASRTVEEQQEDVPHDMRPLVDADGNAWDFAYGMNWSGVIDDARTAKYRK